MADKKITQLTEDTAPSLSDLTISVDIETGTTKKVKLSSLLSLLHPVGSIYTNATSNTNPGTLLGFGTWTAFGAGRVPVGFDSTQTQFDAAEKTGGSKDLQSHSHASGAYRVDTEDSGWGLVGSSSFGGRVMIDAVSGKPTTVTGSGNSGNLQPYVTVYMWKRTA